MRRVLVLLAMLVPLVACSAPEQATRDFDEGPITVGLLTPTTGTVAAAGTDMKHGWELWFRLHGDEVAGRRIETIHEDTAGDPTTTLTKARRIVEQDGAKILAGPLLANEGYALAGYVKETADLVALNPVSSSDDLSQRKRVRTYVRAGGWQSSTPTHPAGDWAAQQGWKKVATLCNDYAFGYENCAGFVNTFTDHGGQVVKQLYAPLGTSDYSSYVAQIDPDEVDGVFVETVGADSPRFLAAWDSLGFKDKVPLISNETTVEQSALRTIKGDGPLGLMSFGHYAEGREDPATADFVREFRKAYGQRPSYYACATYTAAQWLTTALEETGGRIADTDQLLKALEGVQLEDTCFGPMKLDEWGGAVANVYLRKVVRAEDGGLVNRVERTYEDVSQFWHYDPEAFLEQPVYSRGDQGAEWPQGCDAYAKECPLR
jgi:branched-chain amino acid transport system substrate-binding protein